MRQALKLVSLMAVVACSVHGLIAQDLAPRAYVITPLHSNAVTVAWSFYDGSINFNGALPVSDATGRYNVPILSYYHSFNFFGRSANVVATLPYGVGNFQGTINGAGEQPLPFGSCGFGLSRLRQPEGWAGHAGTGVCEVEAEDPAWRQPEGNRSDRAVRSDEADQLGHEPVVLQTGVWLFAAVGQGGARWLRWACGFSRRTPISGRATSTMRARGLNRRSPLARWKDTLSYDFKPRLWASLDGNFWFGGKTSVNGVENPLSEQTNSRLGGTVSFPITKHQSLKFSLQQWNLHSIWRQLSKCHGRMAVFLDW